MAYLANAAVKSALADAVEHFAAAHPASRKQHEFAAGVMPGGNTRSVLYTSPFPITLVGGNGPFVHSLDGQRYLDFLGEYTAGLFGHSNEHINAAIRGALDAGIVLGGHSDREAHFAQLLCDRFPAIERIRFTNSGTEANLLAVSTATVVTGRPKVMVFDGAYHGSVFAFGDSDGALNAPFDFMKAPYNDAETARQLARQHGSDLAAILVEPMLGAGGCIPATAEFLETLREIADEAGSLLIFDEVMTSRLAPGGLHGHYGIKPDLVTLGKYIGGGMSFGAFGGREDIMARFDPRRSDAISHPGTFNNNMVTMSAGIAAMSSVFAPEAATRLTARGNALRERLNAIVREAGLPMQFTGAGSLMTLHMSDAAITRPIPNERQELQDLFYFDLIQAGIWIAKRGMITLSLAIEDGHEDKLVAAVEEFVATRGSLFADAAN